LEISCLLYYYVLLHCIDISYEDISLLCGIIISDFYWFVGLILLLSFLIISCYDNESNPNPGNFHATREFQGQILANALELVGYAVYFLNCLFNTAIDVRYKCPVELPTAQFCPVFRYFDHPSLKFFIASRSTKQPSISFVEMGISHRELFSVC
jgi:hypothetical protein